MKESLLSISVVYGSSISWVSSHVSEAWNFILGVGDFLVEPNDDDLEYFGIGDEFYFGLFYLELDLISFISGIYSNFVSSSGFLALYLGVGSG